MNYKDPDAMKILQKAIGGFDVIIDSAGGWFSIQLLKLCNKGAQVGSTVEGCRRFVEQHQRAQCLFGQLPYSAVPWGPDAGKFGRRCWILSAPTDSTGGGWRFQYERQE